MSIVATRQNPDRALLWLRWSILAKSLLRRVNRDESVEEYRGGNEGGPLEVARKLAGIRQQARPGGAEVRIIPAGSAIHRLERAVLPDGTIYELRSMYTAPDGEATFVSTGTQCAMD